MRASAGARAIMATGNTLHVLCLSDGLGVITQARTDIGRKREVGQGLDLPYEARVL